jgi:hypothetical protein
MKTLGRGFQFRLHLGLEPDMDTDGSGARKREKISKEDILSSQAYLKFRIFHFALSHLRSKK